MNSISPYPLRFRPLIKQTIWGGSRLGSLLGKEVGTEGNDAESWEIVDHGDDQSVVDDGPLAGKTLAELIGSRREWLMGESSQADGFPLLLKYLDCNRVLSVQVHPDDAYGATMEVPDRGKTEAWYVVAAEPESLIYAGLKAGTDRRALSEAMAAGETDSVLHSFHPDPGDCVFIPAGTVHALGAGLVIAEIQQSSNTTFRLFDWNRLGGDGNPRPLHVEQSLEVSDYDSGPVQPRKSDPATEGWQNLIRCDKFRLRTLETGEDTVGGDGEFHVLTVPNGQVTLETDSGSMLLNRGQSVLLPAAMDACRVKLSPESTLLSADPGSE
ncbi:MAG: type I phosphomannose isomerase catalytic subunit [Planctomycetota bacterium]